jgi:hypothetical protein
VIEDRYTMSDPVQPKPAIPLAELSEPIQPKIRVPWWRWVVAILLAPVVFMMSLLPIGILCGQQFNDIPDRWAFVPIIGQLAFGLGVTIWALRGVVRPKPRKQRGFPIQVTRRD